MEKNENPSDCYGFDIIKQITFLKNPEVAKYHHDKSGRKRAIRRLTSGEEIPLGARIITVLELFWMP
jgi:HD-GYP domain-containing protein (c-di-GMP phosphodiesterase class II)